jgi:6-phospho-3-hexuloisomerase
MFAMRLMHVGKQVFVAGDTTTPPIQEGDWIVALSASGETPVTCLLAKGAAKNRGNLIAITATEDSTLSKAAGCTLIIPAPSKRDFERKGSPNEKSASVQFAGSLFEQQALLIFDSLSLALAEAAHLDPATMWKRHANLE